MAVIGLVVPLILALQGDALWVRSATHHERPVVNFTDTFYLLADGQPRASAGPGLTTIANSSDVTVRSSGDVEHIQLEVTIPDGRGDITSLHFVGEFRMELSKKRRIASHTAVGAEFVRPGGVASSSRLDAWLRLELVQKDALDEDRLAGSESLLGQASSRLSSEEGSSDDFLVALGALQASQGVTLVGSRVFPDVWSNPSSADNATVFTARITFVIPEQIVYYRMEGFETWKFAWVQYLSLLVPMYILTTCVLSFCYRNNIVRTFVVDPLTSRRLVVGERIKAA
ncbi:hypothetical protein FOZ63_031626 [Perkinsus olseni]|uniref:Transmembrane protein 231 n=1 Tax=Perkinsus olseni TaxID=32597 RepID=A0A7J6TBI6_PEROL|nr:hypothetical protein FOZ63_031626 [Perkinsus olseni]